MNRARQLRDRLSGIQYSALPPSELRQLRGVALATVDDLYRELVAPSVVLERADSFGLRDYAMLLFGCEFNMGNGIPDHGALMRSFQEINEVIAFVQLVCLKTGVWAETPEADLADTQGVARNRILKIIAAVRLLCNMVVVHAQFMLLDDQSTMAPAAGYDVDAYIALMTPSQHKPKGGGGGGGSGGAYNAFSTRFFNVLKGWLQSMSAARMGHAIMVPEFTQNGHNSWAFKQLCQIDDLMEPLTMAHPELTGDIATNLRSAEHVVRSLKVVCLPELPILRPDRAIHTFEDGVLNLRTLVFTRWEDMQSGGTLLGATPAPATTAAHHHHHQPGTGAGAGVAVPMDEDEGGGTTTSADGGTGGGDTVDQVQQLVLSTLELHLDDAHTDDLIAGLQSSEQAQHLLSDIQQSVAARPPGWCASVFHARCWMLGDGMDVASIDCADPMDIPTPALDHLFDTQGFNNRGEGDEPADAAKQTIYALLGRLLYRVKEKDQWAVMPYFLGVGNSGKSTLLSFVSSFFKPGMVGNVTNRVETVFGMAQYANRDLVVFGEIDPTCTIDQLVFQQMISGEDISLAVKGLKATEVQWRAPLIAAGNRMFGKDYGGALARRFCVATFPVVPRGMPPELGTSLEAALAVEKGRVMLKCARLYDQLVALEPRLPWAKVGCPFASYFHAQRRLVEGTCNSVANFLACGTLEFNGECRMAWDEFERLYAQHCHKSRKTNANHNMQHLDLTQEFNYLHHFDIYGVKLDDAETEEMDPVTNSLRTCRWLRGCQPKQKPMASPMS